MKDYSRVKTIFLSNRKYSLVFFLLMLLLCAASIGVAVWVVDQSEKIHADLVRTQIYELKKNFLKDTVENMIVHIEAVRKHTALDEYNRGEFAAAQAVAAIASDTFTSSIRFPPLAIDEKACMRIVNTYSNKILFSQNEIPSSDVSFIISKSINEYTITYSYPQSIIDAKTKQIIHDEIHAQKFANNSYMWVNEVINWDGGDGYAVRRVHPNLKDTEGLLLSTETKDIAGNMPYLEELNGIKENGSLFSRYYFKRLESNEIAEKLTYASLYKDFNWIIAMGIHVDDLEYYVEKVEKTGEQLNAKVFIIASVFLVFFFTAFFVLFVITGFKYLKQTKAEIRSEANRDPLTGALNRRIGNEVLRQNFIRFKQGTKFPLILSLDIDDFKVINDTYGHDAGDTVLQKLVSVIKNTMRESDFAFRWGGEEFLILYDAEVNKASFLAERLNTSIKNMIVEYWQKDNINTISVTVSIGISWFSGTDSNYQAALKRADTALYEAKKNGKNTYCIKET